MCSCVKKIRSLNVFFNFVRENISSSIVNNDNKCFTLPPKNSKSKYEILAFYDQKYA